ncbi:MAG: helix-turn-helix domain-containing protein [Aridibacter sp.]
MNNQTVSLTEVLENFAFEASKIGERQTTLEKYIAKFPQFAWELKSFAIEKDLLEFSNLETISDAEKQDYLAHSREILSNFLAEFDAPEISSLNALAKRLGMKKRDFAKRLGISISLLIYLEKRRLEFATIPNRFIKKIAEVLGQTENTISNYLNKTADFATGASFKTNERPQIGGQKSFAEAVREDQTLTEAEKRELIK